MNSPNTPPAALTERELPARYESMGYALAMRVMQSDLYRYLDDRELAECDELIRIGQGASAAPSEPSVGTAADGKTEVFSIPGYPLMVRAVDFNAALTSPQAQATHPTVEQRQRVRADAIGAPEAPAVSEAHRQRWGMLVREILSESETLDGVTRLSPGHFKALVAVYKEIATTPPAPEVVK